MVFQPELADGAAAEVTVITSLSEKHSPALWAPLGFLSALTSTTRTSLLVCLTGVKCWLSLEPQALLDYDSIHPKEVRDGLSFSLTCYQIIGQ